jgi:hypothetical protein
MSAPHSRREGAILALRDRLSKITIANGYSCDAGKVIWLGEIVVLGADDPDAQLGLIIGDDSQDDGDTPATSLDCTFPVEVEGIVRVLPSAASANGGPLDPAAPLEPPVVAVERLIADIKRAVELEDRSLEGWATPTGLQRGPTRTIAREAGSEFAGCSVEYRITVEEHWGRP